MSSSKRIVQTAACTAFILALVATASSAKTMTTSEAVPDDDLRVEEPSDEGVMQNKRQTPFMEEADNVVVSAAYEVDGKKERSHVQLAGKKCSSTQKNESVIGAINNAQLTLSRVIIKKSGDTSNQNASAFNGVNAALLATSGSTVTADNCTINTEAEGANGVFATGKNTTVTLHTVNINTTKNSSRGLDATYGGTVVAHEATITTHGAHCAALATDRGGGTVAVNRGSATTHGEGSPVLYSTGDITTRNMDGYSETSEIGVIEGKNGIKIEGGTFSSDGKNGFMLYQSTSGDAAEGTAVLTAKDATFKHFGEGSFFYVTNTDAEATLTNCTITEKNNVLATVAGNNAERGWGKRGSNGATFRLTIEEMEAEGDVNCDAISSVAFSITEGSKYVGTVNGNRTGTVSVSLDNTSKWTLTGDSYVSVIKDNDRNYNNIKSNGHDVYYDQTADGNRSLKGKTIQLKNGGKLRPYTPSQNAVSSDDYHDYDSGSEAKDDANNKPDRVPPFDGQKPQYGEGGGAGAGNLPFDKQNESIDVADSRNSVDGNGTHRMPEMETVTGRIKVTGKGSKRTVDLITSEGRRYALSVFDPNKRPEQQNDRSQKKENVAQNRPQQKPNVAQNDNRSNDREPPKMVTLDELAALDGKQVTLRGVFNEKKTELTVFEYTVKK